MKAAFKREESDASINSSERKQARRIASIENYELSQGQSYSIFLIIMDNHSTFFIKVR